MSRVNKVNKDHYTIAGRLTPDELARERSKQQGPLHDEQGGAKQTLPQWKTATETADKKPDRPRKKR